MKIKVGVIFGGKSVEHEVSIISALQAIDNMDTSKYEVVPIYIAKDGEWYTGKDLKDVSVYKDMESIKKKATNIILGKKNNEFVLQNKSGLFNKVVETIDIAFPIVHGTNVEDGKLQGYLETIGIPYVGVDTYSAVVGQDKVYMKKIFQTEELPITDYEWFYDTDYELDNEAIIQKCENLGYPLIVKPSTLGSSVGIGFAHNKKELKEAIETAITYDSKILVEKVVENLTEVNISVLGNYEHQDISVIEQVNSDNAFLTYEDKYIGESKKGAKSGASKGMLSTNRIIPAPINKKLSKEIEEVAVKAFKALKSSGVVRIDFLIDTKENKPYINEINNIPGSLAFYLWEATDKKYSVLLDELINNSIKEYKKRTSKTNTFETNILNGYKSGVKGLKGAKGTKKI